MIFCAAICALWLAFALRALRGKACPSIWVQGVLVGTAIPLVGMLTYLQGPLMGLGALICVTLVLSLHYVPRLQATRQRDAD